MYAAAAVTAFEPAEAELEEAKDVDAPAPDAPDDALAWMYRLDSLLGSFWNSGSGLQNHVVLVQLRVHRADLALAVGVVERVVDGGRRDAEARGGDAVDDQRNGQAAGLLVGGHVFEFRQLLQLLDEAVGPQVQLVAGRDLPACTDTACGSRGRPP